MTPRRAYEYALPIRLVEGLDYEIQKEEVTSWSSHYPPAPTKKRDERWERWRRFCLSSDGHKRPLLDQNGKLIASFLL